jgi:hypothetical protein
MPSDNVERAKQIIAKYPEVFESLLEFERTKKIPKLYRRKRIDVTIDENVLRDFKNYCSKNGLNMSRLIEKCMVQSIKKESV